MVAQRAEAAGGSRAGEAGPAGGTAALRRALVYLRRYWTVSLGALLALLLVTAANLAVPQFIRIAIDQGVARRQSAAIEVAAAGLVAMALLRGIFTFLQGFLAERASQGVAFDMRDALFAKLQRLSFSYYDRIATGQLLTRVTNDVEQIRAFAGQGVIQIASAAITLVATTVLLFAISWQLTLVALLTIPPLVILLANFVRRVGPLFGRVQMALDRVNGILREDLAGIRTIRAYAREEYETGRYTGANDELLARNLDTVRAIANNFPFVFLLGNLGTLAVVWYGGWQVIGGSLTIGELVAFNAYLGNLLFPVLTLGFQAAGISRAGASAQRVFEIIDAPLDVQDAPDARPLPPLECCVELRDVHFRYPGSDREVLRGVSFIANPGETVAILGTTGSGKSTLVNLVPRFYDVTEGAVLLDFHDVRTVTLASLRCQIGIVLQDALLFSGSVRGNIAYGRPDAGIDEVVAAARAAQADEFIRALPQGYDTVVGERGVGLSGGQRQRIAIARALLIDPRLLILDDSLSAVDAGTEALLLRTIDALIRDRDRTCLVIAQRLSTVRAADRILVLDEGRIVATGTHEQLLRENELYNQILGTQFVDGAGTLDARVQEASA
ncbi:MAG TPA: ABC transporter ATP-binding protein [Chloroflexota bacterium]|nr:ABC transporter ATP-binding protein [Chloroflexota bacterium]